MEKKTSELKQWNNLRPIIDFPHKQGLMNGNFSKRKMRSLSGTRKNIIIALTILLIITVVLYYEHSSIYAIPKSRISLNEYYPELKEDSFNHYINLPIDYNNPASRKYRGFYLFSPNFYKSKNIIFLLTDGQMELVNTETDFDFFEKVLKGSAYVLMGVRGHSPTFFPEVYKNGGVDYEMATKLYNSDQEIEDIEQVRLDLIKKGILAEGSKINIFGASGAGVLAQQYISKYGANVNRVILESTGAPDLAADSGLKYSPDFKDFNPKAARILDSLLTKRKADKATICNILYQVGRSERSPREAQLKILEHLQNGGSLFKYYFNPITNISVLNYMIKPPKEIAARIRWFELVGKDLMGYASQKETNLLYELSSVAVSDLLEYHKQNHIPAKVFKINRSHFPGEVLLLKGTEDVVFSDSINRVIEQKYPNARLLFFKDGHRMQNDKEHYMKIRSAFFAGGFKAQEFLNLVNQH